MRPTPLTMPVNMRRLSSPRRTGTVADASPRAQAQAKIAADWRHIDEAKAEPLLEALEGPQRRETATAAEQARRHV